MELLNVNDISGKHGKNQSTIHQPSKPSLINSAFAGIVSGHLCFNTINNMPSKYRNVNNDMIKQNHWIMDSGASDHISYSLHNFTYVKPVNNCFVQLPNNKKIPISHIGIVKISSSLKLRNVQCVPSFKFNFVSIRQIASDKKTCLLFTDKHCLIQEIPSWTMIGVFRAFF